MRRFSLAIALFVICSNQAPAIKVSLFTDSATFLARAQDIVIAKCLGPLPNPANYFDGLYPVDVQVLYVLKGPKNARIKPGKMKIATIYTMKAGHTYLLTSMGGSAYGTEFLAAPELSVVEVPAGFGLAELKGKTLTEEVQAVFAARRRDIERQQAALAEQKKLLDKALAP